MNYGVEALEYRQLLPPLGQSFEGALPDRFCVFSRSIVLGIYANLEQAGSDTARIYRGHRIGFRESKILAFTPRFDDVY